ncbi:MAG: hypothetical protein ABSE73_13075 [Planctomycetota bacterium]
MEITARKGNEPVRVPGKVKGGKLSVSAKIAIPDGNVIVTVASSSSKPGAKNGLSYEELITHPAFGILKRYPKMADSTACVAALRKREDQRSKHAR